MFGSRHIIIGLVAILTVAGSQNVVAQDFVYNFSSPLLSVDSTGKYTRTTFCEVVAGADGKFFSLGYFGNTTKTREATLLGTSVASPVAYNYHSNLYNKALVLTKHDAHGNVDWQVSSAEGDMCGGSVASTSDGGCVLALKLRYENESEYVSNVLIDLRDASGASTKVTADWDASVFTDGKYHRIYYPVLIKLDANGKVAATKVFSSAHAVAPKASDYYAYGCTDGFELQDVCTDDDDNVYVVGYQREALIVDGDTIEAHNISEWVGNPQHACGSSFVIKFDNNLNYVRHLSSQSEATNDQANHIAYRDGKLYLTGYVKARKTFSIAGATDADADAAPGEKSELWLASLSAADFSVNYLKIYASEYVDKERTEGNKVDVQFVEPSNDNKYVYVGGYIMRAGFVTKDGTSVLPGEESKNCGFVVRIAATDGALEKCYASQAGISMISSVSPNDDGSFWAYGYDWSALSAGDVIRAYLFDSNFDVSQRATLLTQNAMATAKSMARVDNDFVFLAIVASQKSNKVAFLNTDESIEPTTEYTAVAFGYSIAGGESALYTPVDKIESSSDINIYAHNHAAHIIGAAGEVVKIYDARGTLIRTAQLATAREAITLSPGLYIVSVDGINKKITIQ